MIYRKSSLQTYCCVNCSSRYGGMDMLYAHTIIVTDDWNGLRSLPRWLSAKRSIIYCFRTTCCGGLWWFVTTAAVLFQSWWGSIFCYRKKEKPKRWSAITAWRQHQRIFIRSSSEEIHLNCAYGWHKHTRAWYPRPPLLDQTKKNWRPTMFVRLQHVWPGKTRCYMACDLFARVPCIAYAIVLCPSIRRYSKKKANQQQNINILSLTSG